MWETPLAHSHGFWTSTEVAALSAALFVGAAAAAGILLGIRMLVRRRSGGRAPCPGCGTFLAPGEQCPACPPDGRKPGAENEDGP